MGWPRKSKLSSFQGIYELEPMRRTGQSCRLVCAWNEGFRAQVYAMMYLELCTGRLV